MINEILALRDKLIIARLIQHLEIKNSEGASFDTIIIPERLLNTPVSEVSGVKIHVSKYVTYGQVFLVDSKQTIQFGSYHK